ncbi:ribonuclease H protein, partial [Trifolium medium]|nr:ribonuclease H protein [Trifolium medium]
MHDYLNRSFSIEEVTMAMKHLKGNAAPGPDGLNAAFYQQYWEIIGHDIATTVLNILNHEGDPSSINHT